jgi:vancomycin resistance protein YoaR
MPIMRSRWGRGVGVAALICLIGGSTLALGVGLAQGEGDDAIAAGVHVDGLDLAGKSRAQAAEALRVLAERKALTPILFYSGKFSTRTRVKNLGGHCDVDEALDAALEVGRSAAWMERVRARIQGVSGGNSIPFPVSLDALRAAAELKRLARQVEASPVEPRAREEAGKIVATAGRPGRLLDAAATIDRIAAALRDEAWNRALAASVQNGLSSSDWASRARPISLNLVLQEAAPRITADAVSEVQTLLASFTTSFGQRDRNRVHNIHVAGRSINGLFLLPGDEFSYNETVGPRQRRAGYRTAPEIVKGELVPGIGGGVCQVSSTVYNAALLADLEVTRRFHHRFPVHYVAAGRDATVSDGGLDLRLRNRFDAPVALLVDVAGSHIRVRVFGAEHCKRNVKLLTSRLRPPLTKSGGKRVALMRVVEEDGRVTRRETISRDSYEPPPAASTKVKPPQPTRGQG